MEEFFGGAISTVANLALLLYICQRFVAASRQRRKIMAEMREFATIVDRARDNVSYIGEQVSNGMEQIKEDIGKELRVTDRLTTQSVKLGSVLERFASLEEKVIELVRMDRNRESVRIETPENVTEEIERVLAAFTSGRRKEEEREDADRAVASSPQPRIPLSKFSACNPREIGPIGPNDPNAPIGPIRPIASAQKAKAEGRARAITTPEVRLLGETK